MANRSRFNIAARPLLFGLMCSAGAFSAQAAHFTSFTVKGCDAVGNVHINDNGAVAGNCISNFINNGFAGRLGGKIESFRVGKIGPTFLSGLNNKGQSSGAAPTKRDPNANQGFLRSAEGKITRIRGKGEQTALVPSGINDTGEITGYLYEADGSQHGFLRDAKGMITVFDAPGQANTTNVVAINNHGTVAGYVGDSSGHQEGFLRTVDGAFTTFQVPDFQNAAALAINNKDAVTGTAIDDAGNQVGFIRAPDGTIVTFRTGRGLPNVTPMAINDGGVVVGTFENVKKDKTYSFIRFANGTIKTIDVPKSAQTIATSINSKGVVAGYYNTPTGNSVGFTGLP